MCILFCDFQIFYLLIFNETDETKFTHQSLEIEFSLTWQTFTAPSLQRPDPKRYSPNYQLHSLLLSLRKKKPLSTRYHHASHF